MERLQGILIVLQSLPHDRCRHDAQDGKPIDPARMVKRHSVSDAAAPVVSGHTETLDGPKLARCF